MVRIIADAPAESIVDSGRAISPGRSSWELPPAQ